MGHWHPLLALWHGAVHALGVDFGVAYGHWVWYNFWSGSGSDLGEVAIVVGLAGLYRRHNCQVRRCWRIGRHEFEDPGAGVRRLLCWRHHPDVKYRQLTRERLHLYLGSKPGKG